MNVVRSGVEMPETALGSCFVHLPKEYIDLHKADLWLRTTCSVSPGIKLERRLVSA